ncbi:succinate dehydrogenase cytochrome b subunit [Elusimicrobiota bacterium]
MKVIKRFLLSSIGKKQFMAVTGTLLVGFLAAHLAGNLLMLGGADAFNSYAHHLETFPLLIPAELGLMALFLAHIIMGLKLKWENWQARPNSYEVHTAAGGSTWGSSTMVYTGALTLVFILFHVVTIKFQLPQDKTLFAWVIERFQNPLYTGFYVLAVTSLGLHLSHGIRSAFQTFGLSHPNYDTLIKFAGILVAISFGMVFAMLPLWGLLR